jgi:hypothetical protein
MKPLTTSVSPSGHRISIPQPVPGFFRAMKIGRCSNISGICANGGPLQGSHPAPIKLTHYPWPTLLVGNLIQPPAGWRARANHYRPVALRRAARISHSEDNEGYRSDRRTVRSTGCSRPTVEAELRCDGTCQRGLKAADGEVIRFRRG